MNNQRLLAGFFRYHREKLNYSQRGLVDENELSSLSMFEQGKLKLSDDKLIELFKQIGFDYTNLTFFDEFNKEYIQIIQFILSGHINEAVISYNYCINNNVLNTLNCLDFAFLSYLIPRVRNRKIENDDQIITKCINLLTDDQLSMYIASDGKVFRNTGQYDKSISCFKNALNYTNDESIISWIHLQISIAYSKYGDYYNAQKFAELSLRYYSSNLNFNRMIQLNINIGTICMHQESFMNSENYYLNAYKASLQLKDAYKVMTKSYHCLFWLYFKTHQLDKIQDLLMNIPDGLEPIENTYFVLAWSNYKLGNKDEAIRYAVEGKEKYADNKYACTVYQYIENAAKGIKSNQDKLLNRAITMEDYEHNKEIDELFTMELIDIYEGRNTFESVKKANKLYRKLLNRK